MKKMIIFEERNTIPQSATNVRFNHKKGSDAKNSRVPTFNYRDPGWRKVFQKPAQAVFHSLLFLVLFWGGEVLSQNDFIQNIRGYNGEVLDGRNTARLNAPGPRGYFISGFDHNDPHRAFVGRVDDYGNVSWVRYIEDVTHDRMVLEVDYTTGTAGDEVFVAVQASGSVWLYKFDHAGNVVPGWPAEITDGDFFPTAMKPLGPAGEEFGILSIHETSEEMYFTRVHGDIGHPSMNNGSVFTYSYDTPYHEKGANAATFIHKNSGNGNILIIYGTNEDHSEVATFEIDNGGFVQTPLQLEYLEIGPDSERGKIDIHDAMEIVNPAGIQLTLVVGAQLDRPLALYLDNSSNLWHTWGVEVHANYNHDKNHLIAINESNVLEFNFLGVSFDDDSFYSNGGGAAQTFMVSMKDVSDGFSPLPHVFVTEVYGVTNGFRGLTKFPVSFANTPLQDPVVAMQNHGNEMPVVFFDGIDLTGACALNPLSPVLYDTKPEDVKNEPIGEVPHLSNIHGPQTDVMPPMPRDYCGSNCPVNNLAVTFTTTGCLSSGTLDITANVTGNLSPPTYIWYPSGINNQTLTGVTQPGVYEVVVSDPANGCHIIASINITDLQVTVSVDDEECDGMCDAQVTANPTGGTPPYTYLWTFGGATTQTVTNLCNNSGFGPADFVTVTDANGCTVQSAPVSIGTNQPGPGFSYTSNITDASCFGACDGEAEFILTPPPGTVPGHNYSFDWNDLNNDGPIRDEMCDGSYAVTITHSNSQGDCELTENVTINYNNPSDWHKQSSTIGGNYDAVVNDVENDMEHVYVYGTFENQTVIDGVNINSGNGQSGVYVVKYDRCGTMEWVAYTDATGYNVGFTAVDIEYRYNELHLLFHNDNALQVFQQPHLKIKDNTGNDILNPGGTPIPGAPFNVAPNLSDGEYVIGRINNAGTFAQLDPLYLEMDADDELTSLDYIENPASGTINYYVAGRHSNQAYIAELELITGGAIDYHEPDQNYCYGHTPGSGLNNDFDIINDIEKYHGPNITNDLIYITGRYESADLFNSTIPSVSGDYDAFTGAMEVDNLADGFDFLGTASNEYVIEGGSYYRAEGNEIDYREINGNYQPIVIGNYQDGIINYGLPSTSAQLNTFIAYFEDLNTHINYMYSASFEDNFVQSPNNYATGHGLIINPVEGKLYATGEFNSWTDLIALDQPTISIHQNEWVKNMWVAELDLEANFQWLAGGLAPTGTPIIHTAPNTPQGVRSNGVATVGKRAFVGGYANIQVDLEPSQTSGSIYALPTVPIAPVGVVNANLEMYTVRIGELSFGGGGVFHKKDPNTTSNENDLINQPQFETRLMPNPSNGEVRIELQSNYDENWNISVFNTMGQQVVEVSNLRVENNSIEMNWSDLAAGMYLVKINQGNHTATQKLIVR